MGLLWLSACPQSESSGCSGVFRPGVLSLISFRCECAVWHRITVDVGHPWNSHPESGNLGQSNSENLGQSTVGIFHQSNSGNSANQTAGFRPIRQRDCSDSGWPVCRNVYYFRLANEQQHVLMQVNQIEPHLIRSETLIASMTQVLTNQNPNPNR